MLVPKIITVTRGGKTFKTTVRVNPDRDKDLVKRAKTLILMKKYNSINNVLTEDTKKGNEHALMANIMLNTAMRIGNEESSKGYLSHHTKKYVKTYGLNTITKKHVTIKGNDVHFKFTGKRGVEQDIILTNKIIANNLKNLLKNKEASDTIFGANYYEFGKYIKSILGDNISPKDLRMVRANIVWLKESSKVLKTPKPKTKAEYNKELNDILTKVSNKLGNTKGVAKKSYVDDYYMNLFEKQRWNR